MRFTWLNALRTRLIAGAGAIALLAFCAAVLAAYGSTQTARQIDRAMAAQARMELLATLSRRISDYALLAVETAGGAMPSAQRQAQLDGRTREVGATFERVGAAISSAVAAAEGADEETQMLLATQGLTLARMQAQFEGLKQAIETSYQGGSATTLRPALDGFATQFSPLLNTAIEEERRNRDRAAERARDLRSWMSNVATAAAIAAPLLLLIFAFGLVRPLLSRIAQVADAAPQIGGATPVALPLAKRDELGVLFAKINLLAARLERRRIAVDADRAQLNEVIEARTKDLSAANDRLSAIDTERRRFFADIGHELRTPLTVILAECDLMLSAPKNDEDDVRSGMAVIQSRAKRLNRRIDDLLRVARSESGQIELDMRDFALADCLRDAVDDVSPNAKRRGVQTLAELDPELAALGDRDWCRQVASGLLDNALRHTPEGGRVAVLARREGDQAVFCVLDEGPGLAAADQKAVFERFTRGSRAEGGLGFGVGLALAKWIVERQSGSISLTSPTKSQFPGEGEGCPMRGPGLEVTVRLQSGTRAVDQSPRAQLESRQ